MVFPVWKPPSTKIDKKAGLAFLITYYSVFGTSVFDSSMKVQSLVSYLRVQYVSHLQCNAALHTIAIAIGWKYMLAPGYIYNCQSGIVHCQQYTWIPLLTKLLINKRIIVVNQLWYTEHGRWRTIVEIMQREPTLRWSTGYQMILTTLIWPHVFGPTCQKICQVVSEIRGVMHMLWVWSLAT